MRPGRILVGIVAAIVVAASCGSSSKGGSTASTSAGGGSSQTTLSVPSNGSAGGSTSAVDPCSLLTQADVTAAFALSDVSAPIDKVTTTKNVITPDTASCEFDWHASNDNSSNFALYVYPASVYDNYKTGTGGSETVPAIPGAYKNADGYFVKAGNITLSITGVASEAAVGKLFELASAKVG